MRIFALCSWFEEEPEHLYRMARSCGLIADHLVAVDGAYASFPGACGFSGSEQHHALFDACTDGCLGLSVHAPARSWQGGEVEKRAAMFEYARAAGATPDDWLLIIDGDMLVHEADPEAARAALGASERDSAEVRWQDIRPDGQKQSDQPFRSMFRAIPGLTVKWTHWLYVAADSTQPTGWRYLWHYPNGHITDEPAEDLTGLVTLHHRRLDRSGDRDGRSRTYYRERDRDGLELAPHW